MPDSQFELRVKDEPIPPRQPAQQATNQASKLTSPVTKPSIEPAQPAPRPPPASAAPRPTALPGSAEEAAAREAVEKELALDELPVIDVEKALDQSSGDYEFLLELMASFQSQYTKQLKELTRGFEARDWNVVALEAHSLKGAAANLFIMHMKTVCFCLEKTGKALRLQVENGEEVTDASVAKVAVLIRILQETFASFETALKALEQNAPH